jgi:uncharacterized protein (DUF433 family)
MSPMNSDPEILGGTTCFTGTRVPIKSLFDYIAHNHPIEEFLEDFPSVTREQVLAVLDLARERVIHPANAA